MTASAWATYDMFPEYLGDGTIDMDGDTFHVALFQSTSNCATLTHSVLADLDNEVSGNGYSRDTSNTVTWGNSSGTTTFDITTDPQFTASGGTLAARFAVIFDDTPSSPADPLVCVSLLDTTPADVSVSDGSTLTLTINASGVFAISDSGTAS